MIKMVISSFYNTLIDKEDSISMSTMLEIDRIRSKGIKFSILTNRSYKDVEYYNRDYPFIDYIIAFNGNLLYEVSTNKVLYSSKLTNKEIDNIINKYPNNKILLYGIDNIYNINNYMGNDIYKIEIVYNNIDSNNKLLFKYNKCKYIEYTHNNNYIGLYKLLDILGISKMEVLLIIGNNSEEVLVNSIDNTYIVNNSSKLLKGICNNRTKGNNYKGVELLLKKL